MVETQFNFDSKDLKIIKIYDIKTESKIATKEISEKLGLPDRSIRYRLAKLREKNIIIDKEIITHERKFGLNEFVIAAEVASQYRSKIREIVAQNQALTWAIPTIGTLNGLIIHAINPIMKTNNPRKLMEKLKEKEYVKKYTIFEMVDHYITGWDYNWFDKDCNWNWTWGFWNNKIIHNEPKKVKINYSKNPNLEDFDYYDIKILKNLHTNAGLSQKDIANKLGISESLVSRKIRKMEQNGIIRGYETAFKPFSDLVTIICIFNGVKSKNQILGFLSYIPYPKTIAYQDNKNLAIAINLPKKCLVDFLRGIYSMEKMMRSVIVQIWLETPKVPISQSYDLFNEDTNSWDNIESEFEKTFQKL